MYYLGLDLGQAQDYTALVVVERIGTGEDLMSHLRHIYRYPLRTPYPEIVDSVLDKMKKPPLKGKTALVVDATGVGAAVIDMFSERGLAPVQVKIHGGDKMTRDGQECRVPKRDLASAVQYYLQNRLLKISDRLKMADVLLREMMAFRVKISASGHDSYEAWREGDHDDLVIALAMVCWYMLEGGYGTEEEYDYSRNTEEWPPVGHETWKL